MQPDHPLQRLQKPAICPHPDPDKSISCLSFYFFIVLLILFSHLCLDLPSALFHSGFTTKSLHVLLFFLMCATSPAQLTLLYLMNPTLFGWGAQITKPPSPCKFLHPTVESFLFGPDIFFGTLSRKCQPFSSLNPMKSTINVHYIWVWLLIRSMITKSTLIRSTFIISRVRSDSLRTTALKGPNVAGLNQNEYRALTKL